MAYAEDAFISDICQRNTNIDSNVFNFQGDWIQTSSNSILPERGSYEEILGYIGLISSLMLRMAARRTPQHKIEIKNDCGGFTIPHCSPSASLYLEWDPNHITGDQFTLGSPFTFTDPNVGSHEATAYLVSSKHASSKGFQYMAEDMDHYCGAFVQYTFCEQTGQRHKHYRMLFKEGNEDVMMYRWVVTKSDGDTKDLVKWYKRSGPPTGEVIHYNAEESTRAPISTTISTTTSTTDSVHRTEKKPENQPPEDVKNIMDAQQSIYMIGEDNPNQYPQPVMESGSSDDGVDPVYGDREGRWAYIGEENRLKFIPEGNLGESDPRTWVDYGAIPYTAPVEVLHPPYNGGLDSSNRDKYFNDVKGDSLVGGFKLENYESGVYVDSGIGGSGSGNSSYYGNQDDEYIYVCVDSICDGSLPDCVDVICEQPAPYIEPYVEPIPECGKNGLVCEEPLPQNGVPCGDGELCEEPEPQHGVPCGDGELCEESTSKNKKHKKHKGRKDGLLSKQKKNKHRKNSDRGNGDRPLVQEGDQVDEVYDPFADSDNSDRDLNEVNIATTDDSATDDSTTDNSTVIAEHGFLEDDRSRKNREGHDSM